MTQLDFDFCETNDAVGQRVQEAVMRIVRERGVVTSDDVAHLSTGHRSRAIIGGVFAGLVKAGILRVLPERVASKQEQAHYRKIQVYALSEVGIERAEMEAGGVCGAKSCSMVYGVSTEPEIVPCGATSDV